MKVHLIKETTIRNYIKRQAGSSAAFEQWFSKLFMANWDSVSDIQKTFGSADLLLNGSSRVVFDIGGNNYRMICKYGFGEKEVHLFVCWIGTHAEYSKLCKINQQYNVFEY